MTSKIFKSIFFTTLTVLVCACIVFSALSYNGYIRLSQREAERECRLVKEGIEHLGEEYIEDLVVEGVRVTLIRPDGTVVYDSDEDTDPSTMENHKNREEIAEALSESEGAAMRFSASKMTETVYYAILLSSGSVVRVAIENHAVLAVMIGAATPFLILLLGLLAFAFLTSVRLTRRIVKPLNELDLDHPEGSVPFEEVRPIVEKLGEQSRRITEQMRELSLRRSEFDSITSNMSSGMIIINARAEVLSCNNSARQIFAPELSEIPKNLLTLYNTESFRAALSKALSGENGYCVLRRDERCYSIVIAPVVKGSIVEGAVIITIDDTEKDKREELRREFSANVSHELKTPLTSIMGYAELISNGIADGDDAVSFAENIHSEAKRLLALVGDIIRLNQVDGGEIPYDGKIEITSLCREAAERLEGVARAGEITVSVEGEECFILGNNQIFEEMIYNLIDNSIKYGRIGGFVKVKVEKSSTGAVVTVSDNGIGIPKGQQERVFERFYRVDKSHSRSKGGTGLGLSIVKHAVAYHKGTLSLESELNSGTCVRMEFPADLT